MMSSGKRMNMPFAFSEAHELSEGRSWDRDIAVGLPNWKPTVTFLAGVILCIDLCELGSRNMASLTANDLTYASNTTR